MSGREIGWLVWLIGLPFAHFVWHRVDIWHAQTAWAQAGLAGMLAWMLVKTERPIIRNLPMAAWLLWVCWQTLYIWQISLGPQLPYPASLLMPWLHAMCLPLFYLVATTQWTLGWLEELLRWLSRVALVLVAYGLIQLANLDQFYRHVEWTTKDPLIGTIGNPSDFGVQLALLLPAVLWRRRAWWNALAIGMVGVIGLTHSAMGAVSAVIALAWWCGWRQRRWVWVPVCLLLLGGIWVWQHPAYLNPEGRPQVWRLNWQDYAGDETQPRGQAKPTITGFGVGYVMARAQTRPIGDPLRTWKHVHNAPFQVLIELGLIGVLVLLWGLLEAWQTFWRVRQHDLAIVLGGMWLIFCLGSLVHPIDHLWVTASLGLVGYCGLYVLDAERYAG